MSLFLPKFKKLHCLKVFLELSHDLISHVSFRDSSQHIFIGLCAKKTYIDFFRLRILTIIYLFICVEFHFCVIIYDSF